ncbi:hypothetical protein ACRRTK_014850 [Alexandromys fortis]
MEIENTILSENLHLVMDGDRDRVPHWSTGLSSQGPNEEQMEGEHEQGCQDHGGVHPPTETVGLIYWELTKASWTVTEKAWDKTGLSDHGEQ